MRGERDRLINTGSLPTLNVEGLTLIYHFLSSEPFRKKLANRL
jgi:hypothetical protein